MKLSLIILQYANKLCFHFQYLVTENYYVKRGIKKCVRCMRPKRAQSQYKMLEKQLSEADWPEVGEKTYPLPSAIDMNALQVHVENIPLSNPPTR